MNQERKGTFIVAGCYWSAFDCKRSSVPICVTPDASNWLIGPTVRLAILQKLSLFAQRLSSSNLSKLDLDKGVFSVRTCGLAGPYKSHPLRMSYLFMRDISWLGNVCQASRWGGHQWRQLNTSEALSQIFPLSLVPLYPPPSPSLSLTDDNSAGVKGSRPDSEGHHQPW